ncbi:F0F1 ATP synthase subunit B [Synechococcus sp. Cruz-9H2]|uniref:F0F1 ATP synthase subunit B n=1 Tax=unclassified Synechococcus TaxID=2626047 RepID=UPI0020CFD32D|nr:MULTISPECIES: F0F1 ATP synthase subunit B [unclassified Synechococcus]MCP9819098.1 F0F1 ATP synthase subunit B [Synechococcus sp. Cruz-9H2]MCP9843602.1 F0F1 ATP synthase subunit B [Synechococcus sp. Edmonson 11F2]MCP9855679.1 F0F1 ATP synthase subunit B [Synechococcus sp. Cruz-9C9]MCP9863117.1 F0F1 ATP synthase subunit B [Synechococcus sp. Cruz-7E5]MCP9870008.1 F0F1 ATP synthase subunit B [Synechococcus sp. Cruz-7B9]
MNILTSVPSFLASEGGFGLNLNLFETNIINLAIVIAALVWFLPKVLGGILATRRATILADLQDAEQRLLETTTALAAAKQDLADAQMKAEKIRSDARARADALRLDSERRTVDEMARLKQGAVADLQTEASRVSEQLRREAARRAVDRALASLPGKLDAEAQARFIDQSINSLGQA